MISMSCPWNNSPHMDKGSFDWMQTIKSEQDIREDSNRIFRPASSIQNHSMSLQTSWAKYICGVKYYIWNRPENLGAFSGLGPRHCMSASQGSPLALWHKFQTFHSCSITSHVYSIWNYEIMICVMKKKIIHYNYRQIICVGIPYLVAMSSLTQWRKLLLSWSLWFNCRWSRIFYNEKWNPLWG